MIFLGAIATLSIFTHCLKMHDSLVGIIGSISKIAASFVFAFAVNSFEFYLGPVVEFFHYASLICMRSIASKMVEKNEIVSGIKINKIKFNNFLNFRED